MVLLVLINLSRDKCAKKQKFKFKIEKYSWQFIISLKATKIDKEIIHTRTNSDIIISSPYQINASILIIILLLVECDLQPLVFAFYLSFLSS